MNAEEGEFRLEKHRWIAELAPTKSFADIGGLWGTVNETVSIAMRYGAREATMVDIQAAGSRWWTSFHERCAELGVSGYHSVVGDICDDRFVDDLGCFDITHCSGILYHLPHPLVLIRNLIAITRERFILSSMIVPDRMENRFGTLELARGQCLLVPAISGPEREILAEHFNEKGITVRLEAHSGSLTWPDGRFRYGPWWRLFTAETLCGMCEVFGVTVEKTWHSPHSSLSVLARLDSTNEP